MRLRKDLVQSATLRTAPGVFEERHATWLELFYDLAFVAAIGQVSTALSTRFDWNGGTVFLALFVPLWWAWVGQAFYLSRFDSDDLLHRVMALAQILIVAAISVHVLAAFEGKPQAFALGYAALRGILIVQYVIAGAQLKKARPLTTRYAVGFAIAALLWVLSAFLPVQWSSIIWALAIAIDFTTPFTCHQLAIDIPPDYSHIPERFGLFTIIVLGEAILAAVSGMRIEGLGSNGAIVGPIGLVLAFAIWWVYFDGVKGHQVRIPQRRQDVRRLMVWLYSHLPLSAGIVVSALGIRVAMTDQAGSMRPDQTLMTVVALGMVLLALQFIYWAGLNPKLMKIAHKLGWPHYTTTACVVPVGLFGHRLSSAGLVAVLCGLTLLHVLWTLRDLPEMEELLAKVESARQQTASQV